jgi:hypothetical protein
METCSLDILLPLTDKELIRELLRDFFFEEMIVKGCWCSTDPQHQRKNNR